MYRRGEVSLAERAGRNEYARRIMSINPSIHAPHLCTLPGEIRNHISSLVLLSPTPLAIASGDFRRPGLPAVCRQLRKETLPIYLENTFVLVWKAGYDQDEVVRNWLDKLPPLWLKYLTRLHIRIEDVEFHRKCEAVMFSADDGPDYCTTEGLQAVARWDENLWHLKATGLRASCIFWDTNITLQTCEYEIAPSECDIICPPCPESTHMLYEGVIIPLLKLHKLYDTLTCPRHVLRSWKEIVRPQHAALYGGNVVTSSEDEAEDEEDYLDFLYCYFKQVDNWLLEIFANLYLDRVCLETTVHELERSAHFQRPRGMYATFFPKAVNARNLDNAQVELRRCKHRYACYFENQHLFQRPGVQFLSTFKSDEPSSGTVFPLKVTHEEFKRNRARCLAEDVAIGELQIDDSDVVL